MAAKQVPVKTIAERDGTAFENVAQALASLTTEERSLSQIYLVQNGSEVDRYFFKDGVEDADFVQWNTEAAAAATHDTYAAILNQSGSNAPSVQALLQNDLGGTVVWTRASTGNYYGTLAGAFTNLKILPFSELNPAIIGTEYYCSLSRYDNDTVLLQVFDSSGTHVDGFFHLGVKIEVYP